MRKRQTSSFKMALEFDNMREQYEDLLVKRDQLQKEANSIRISYNQEFGDLLLQAVEMKIACIREKKRIGYAQAMVNRGESVDTDAVNALSDGEMTHYYMELKEMASEMQRAKKCKTASDYEFEQSKAIYRRLAKMMHPDVHPEAMEISELADLWEQIRGAYLSNNPMKLEELEVLAGRFLSKYGIAEYNVEIVDIENKIAGLEKQINTIIGSEPYTFNDLLCDEGRVQAKKNQLTAEIREYASYYQELQEIFAGLLSKGGFTLRWQMN